MAARNLNDIVSQTLGQLMLQLAQAQAQIETLQEEVSLKEQKIEWLSKQQKPADNPQEKKWHPIIVPSPSQPQPSMPEQPTPPAKQ